jgi:hypothetical protein
VEILASFTKKKLKSVRSNFLKKNDAAKERGKKRVEGGYKG